LAFQIFRNCILEFGIYTGYEPVHHFTLREGRDHSRDIRSIDRDGSLGSFLYLTHERPVYFKGV